MEHTRLTTPKKEVCAHPWKSRHHSHTNTRETKNKTVQRQKRGKEERTSVLFSIQHTCPISLRLRLFSTQKPQHMHRNLIQQQLWSPNIRKQQKIHVKNCQVSYSQKKRQKELQQTRLVCVCERVSALVCVAVCFVCSLQFYTAFHTFRLSFCKLKKPHNFSAPLRNPTLPAPRRKITKKSATK